MTLTKRSHSRQWQPSSNARLTPHFLKRDHGFLRCDRQIILLPNQYVSTALLHIRQRMTGMIHGYAGPIFVPRVTSQCTTLPMSSFITFLPDAILPVSGARYADDMLTSLHCRSPDCASSSSPSSAHLSCSCRYSCPGGSLTQPGTAPRQDRCCAVHSWASIPNACSRSGTRRTAPCSRYGSATSCSCSCPTPSPPKSFSSRTARYSPVASCTL